jgi:enoyl-CoA hydratase/carnithine racemase
MNLTTDLRVEWWPQQVLVLTIDRPGRRNTVDHGLLEAIATAIEANGREAGAIVLRGAGGKAFSAGCGDRKPTSKPTARSGKLWARSPTARFQS